MLGPEDAARARLAAIEQLQQELAGYLPDMQRALYEGLLSRLQEVYDNPGLLTTLLAEFGQAVHLPVAVRFGEALLELVQLNTQYVAAVATNLSTAELTALRAPLDTWLRAAYGIGPDGLPTPGGYLAGLVGDTGPARVLRLYAYRAQATGVGLQEYRQGLQQLVQGAPQGQGMYQQLYKESFDQFNSADRVLQDISATELGWSAFLYQGGLIESSRPFCKVRNGKVFLRSEVEKFGTSKDAYGGYSNKAEGKFDGKPAGGYDPFVQLGGANCRHLLSGLPNTTALRLRNDLKEDAKGMLYVVSEAK